MHCPRGSLKPEVEDPWGGADPPPTGLGDGLKHNGSLPAAHLLLMNRMNQNLQASDLCEFAVLHGETGEQQIVPIFPRRREGTFSL